MEPQLVTSSDYMQTPVSCEALHHLAVFLFDPNESIVTKREGNYLLIDIKTGFLSNDDHLLVTILDA